VGSLQLGDSVRVFVDGVAEPSTGTISYIAPRAEYTPPVVYSIDNRNKFVFLVEAVFEPEVARELHPGQPVEGRARRGAAMSSAQLGAEPATEVAIDVRGMTKRFGRLTAVDHIDLRVGAGEICGFLGPNGSGKTTFIRMLCGLLRPDEGSGTCLGFDVMRASEEIKRHVGYMTQRFSFWRIFDRREPRFRGAHVRVPRRREAVAASLERLGLEPSAASSSRARSPAAGSSASRSRRA
jgi:ABC-type glutathione transport system ATPase component